MFFYPILGVIGLLSLSPVTCLENLGSVFTDPDFKGQEFILRPGCHSFPSRVSGKISSYRLLRDGTGRFAKCKFWDTYDCDPDRVLPTHMPSEPEQRGLLFIDSGGEDKWLQTVYDDRIRSTDCEIIQEGYPDCGFY